MKLNAGDEFQPIIARFYFMRWDKSRYMKKFSIDFFF